MVASALFFAAVCWGGSIRAGDTSRINKLIRKAGSVIGIKLDPFEAEVERRTLNRLLFEVVPRKVCDGVTRRAQYPLRWYPGRSMMVLLGEPNIL